MLSYKAMASPGMPLRFGTPDEFAELRDILTRAGYTEAVLSARLHIPSFAKFGSVEPGVRPTIELATPLDALIRLFLECEPASKALMAALLGDEAIDLFGRLGLVAADPEDADLLAPTIGLCPTRGVYLVNDKGGDLGGLAEDVVYPAILENTQNFLSIIPRNPCRSFLDLGAGTGVAALIAAEGYAEHAWACDIAQRSADFSEFNRRLNGLENVTVGCGDLYDPVEGLQFDRIVTHPPYVPVLKPTCIFRDGGDDGEQIVRRVIQGLPAHLAKGGRFYALTLLGDREGEPVEDRIRRWLGESSGEFDVLLILETAREPADFIGRAMQKGTHRLEELSYWSRLFRELNVRYLVYGCVLIQRRAEERAPFTARLQKGPDSGPAEAEWALAWNTAAAQPGARNMMLDSHPRLSPYLHLAVLHAMQNGGLVPKEFMLRARHPFESECKCPAWVAALIGKCDGTGSGRELLEELKQTEVIQRDTDAGEFAEILKMLTSSGFLDIEGHEIPRIERG
jgi:SAM-dependent methyltransferase